MNCDEWFEKLYQILDKDLDDAACRELKEHMQHCRPCWDRYEFERRLKDRLKSSCCQESCTSSLRDRIKSFFDKF